MKDMSLSSLAEASNQALVGGKAQALGKMMRAGFNVPIGFVVSADCFIKMTPALEKNLLSAFDLMGASYVAVRSSAKNEDGADSTWAGQLDTFLNCDRQNLVKKIEACWKSASSDRAVSYAKQSAIQSTEVAVIVQEMIQSQISGVAFSVHPVSNDSTQIVIEAGLGLGEAIVSGQITPDTYVVDKSSGRILESHISPQHKKLVIGIEGETSWENIFPVNHNQKLNSDQIAELCKVTTQLEKFFEHSVDVEWAICDNELYILQCRPVTIVAGK
jgi:pyruvate, water dikinase